MIFTILYFHDFFCPKKHNLKLLIFIPITVTTMTISILLEVVQMKMAMILGPGENPKPKRTKSRPKNIISAPKRPHPPTKMAMAALLASAVVRIYT